MNKQLLNIAKYLASQDLYKEAAQIKKFAEDKRLEERLGKMQQLKDDIRSADFRHTDRHIVDVIYGQDTLKDYETGDWNEENGSFVVVVERLDGDRDIYFWSKPWWEKYNEEISEQSDKARDFLRTKFGEKHKKETLPVLYSEKFNKY